LETACGELLLRLGALDKSLFPPLVDFMSKNDTLLGKIADRRMRAGAPLELTV
jgi:hypothetical protein